jgi:hypothetical protein
MDCLPTVLLVACGALLAALGGLLALATCLCRCGARPTHDRRTADVVLVTSPGSWPQRRRAPYTALDEEDALPAAADDEEAPQPLAPAEALGARYYIASGGAGDYAPTLAYVSRADDMEQAVRALGERDSSRVRVHLAAAPAPGSSAVDFVRCSAVCTLHGTPENFGYKENVVPLSADMAGHVVIRRTSLRLVYAPGMLEPPAYAPAAAEKRA